MTLKSSNPVKLVNVRGTELLASDTRDQYRQKIARITLDSMVQFVGLLDAEGTVLEINHVALDAVGVGLSLVEGKPFGFGSLAMETFSSSTFRIRARACRQRNWRRFSRKARAWASEACANDWRNFTATCRLNRAIPEPESW